MEICKDQITDDINFQSTRKKISPFAVTLADSKYEDCEKPPEVEYASIVIAYDETEEFVTAKYRCHEGYKLVGKNEITCEFETDEWQGNPPSCESGECRCNYNYCSYVLIIFFISKMLDEHNFCTKQSEKIVSLLY